VCALRDNTVKKGTKDGVSGYEITPEDRVILNKDVKVQFDGGLRKQRLFSFWMNTDFVKDGVVRIEKEEIDKVSKDKKVRNFFVEISFEAIDKFHDEKDDTNNTTESLKDPVKEIEAMAPEQVVVTALRLQDTVVIRNRGWRQEIYKDCFTGQDAVKALQNSGTFSSLQACVEFGNLLIKEGIMYCVKREDEEVLTTLVNGPYFYRFQITPDDKY